MQFVHCSIISFWAVLPPRASIGHKSFKCGGLPSFRLDLTRLGLLRLEQGRRELFNLCASDQFACRQTNFVMQSQALHLLLSRLERLTYVNDKSKGGGNWSRPQCGIQDGAQDGDVCSICSKDRLRERAEENLNQAHA